MAEPAKTAGGYLYHPIYGKSAFMYQVDISNPLHGALTRFPDEWKDRPWTDAEIEAWKKSKQAVAEVKAVQVDCIPDATRPAPAPKKPRGRPFTKKQPEAEKVDA